MPSRWAALSGNTSLIATFSSFCYFLLFDDGVVCGVLVKLCRVGQIMSKAVWK